MSEYVYGTDGHQGHWLTGEEIVRCRDCEHFTLEGSYRFEDGSTNVDFCEYVRGWLLQVTPDGFCAWGERKAGE